MLSLTYYRFINNKINHHLHMNSYLHFIQMHILIHNLSFKYLTKRTKIILIIKNLFRFIQDHNDFTTTLI